MIEFVMRVMVIVASAYVFWAIEPLLERISFSSGVRVWVPFLCLLVGAAGEVLFGIFGLFGWFAYVPTTTELLLSVGLALVIWSDRRDLLNARCPHAVKK